MKDFITFFAPFPNMNEAQEGFSSRVLSIHQLFSLNNRIYIEFADINNLLEDLTYLPRFRVLDNTYILKIARRSIFSFVLVFLMLSISKKIYIHSIYNATYIVKTFLSRIFREKIILDLHGVVPEEINYLTPENQELFINYNQVEKNIIENSYLIVFVSRSMENHFKDKYQESLDSSSTKFIYLPIFVDEQINSKELKYEGLEKNEESIIHAGGTTKWHNIDLMIQCAKEKYSDFEFLFYSHNIEAFTKKLVEANILDNVHLSSVKPSEVKNVYKKAKFGFLLRDNHILNRVACPTKLIEYFYYGVVPIVLQPEIGDFYNLGYKYVLFEDLLNGEVPSNGELEAMRMWNFNILKRMSREIIESIEKLKNLVFGRDI